MNTVTVHRFSTRLGDYAFRTHDEAASFAAHCTEGGRYATGPIKEVVVSLPDAALWHGDVIAAEVLRGQQSDDEGFDAGGKWVPVVGYIVPARGITFSGDKISGIWADIVELGTEAVVGVLNAAAPGQAAAVRNISIVRRRAADAGKL